MMTANGKKDHRSIDDRIQRFLSLSRIAVVGISREKGAACNALWSKLKAHGFALTGIHPEWDSFDGSPCFPSVLSMPTPPEGIFIMTRPEACLAIVREAVTLPVCSVWMHCALGTKPGLMGKASSVSQEAVSLCESHGIEVIPGSCPAQFIAPDCFHLLLRKTCHLTGMLER